MNNAENTKEYEILLDVVRQSYASVVWTHKIQEKQADIYSERGVSQSLCKPSN